MDMLVIKDKAIKYLIENSILHMDMIEVIRRNTAEILYAEIDGVLLKEKTSGAYMLSIDNFEKGRQLLNDLENCNLIVVHQKYMVDYILNRFKLNGKIECFQAVYMNKNKLSINEEIEIKQLELSQIDIILNHYDKLSRYEVQMLLNDGKLFGGYKDNILVGFIGTHLEGSIGILEVFYRYRGLGYATILESYMVNRMIEQGSIPFAQIEVSNKKSINLQKKLGFKMSKESLFWIL